MTKKIILACFALAILALFGSLILNFTTQSKVSADNKEVQKSNFATKVFQNYKNISSLPADKRREAFNALPAENQVKLYRQGKALQLVKTQNLSRLQKATMLKSISSTPSSADLERTFENQEDFALLARYNTLIENESLHDRKAAFRNSSAEDMSNFWKIHLASRLAEDETLSQSQSDLISNVIEFIKTAHFEILEEGAAKTKLDEEIEELTGQINALFTEEKAVEIFARLGGPAYCEEPDENSLLARDCSCRQSWRECNRDQACSGGGCDSTWFGCGFIWLQSCNGECRRFE